MIVRLRRSMFLKWYQVVRGVLVGQVVPLVLQIQLCHGLPSFHRCLYRQQALLGRRVLEDQKHQCLRLHLYLQLILSVQEVHSLQKHP